jgi:hypothetical protein
MAPDEDELAADDAGDQEWADRLGPSRRQLVGMGLAALTLASARAGAANPAPAASATAGRSPWGYDTYKEPTARPPSVRPGEQKLPSVPRKYTDIKSYHAHVYFDEDNYEKAARLRQWVAERFLVELGNWNLQPRGPHVSPSFYFGFGNELLPMIVPRLQLNSLG